MKRIQPQKSYHDFREPKRKKGSQFFGKLLLLILVTVVFYVLFTYVLPSVKVSVFLEAEDFEKDFDVVLDQNIALADFAGEKIIFPAKIYALTGEESGEFEASGEKNMGDKAKASAIFYNHTGRSQPLTTKIELVHSSGKRYFLTEDLTVPPANVSDIGEIVPGTIQAEIEAPEGGKEYNEPKAEQLNVSVLSLDLQSKIYANISEIKGGTDKIVKVVSQEDIDNGQSELVKKLEPKLKEDLEKRLKKSEEVLFPELTLLAIKNVEKSSQLSEETENFKIKIEAEFKALVFNGLELKKYLRDISLAEVPESKMVQEDDFGELKVETKELDLEKGIAQVKVIVRYKILPQVDLAELKNSIKGLPEAQARRVLLNQENIRDVRFDFSMNLSNRIPENLNKIEIKAGN